jgi:hypothetical protein
MKEGWHEWIVAKCDNDVVCLIYLYRRLYVQKSTNPHQTRVLSVQKLGSKCRSVS